MNISNSPRGDAPLRSSERAFSSRPLLHLKAIFGLPSQRRLARALLKLDAIRHWESTLQSASDAELLAFSHELRGRARGGQSLDVLLPEAFGAVTVALQRHVGLRPFDVQLAAAHVMHQGAIAELATGEGKTLVATLAAYLNALPGLGVHVATVNDYLANRDAEWFRPAYEALGMKVGVVRGEDCDRAQAYRCDVTYATAAELGFDFLRDRLKLRGKQHARGDVVAPWRASAPECGEQLEAKVQRGHYFALVDEADHIFIDDARTPLLISLSANSNDADEQESAVCQWSDQLARQLTPNLHFRFDDKDQRLELTREGKTAMRWAKPPGAAKSPRLDKLYSYLERSLHAHYRLHRDKDYLVQEQEILLLSVGSGRPQPGRKWTEGLHQAVEAKEGIPIKKGGEKAARITFQSYFRQYHKLGGMTGTASENARELGRVFRLRVVPVPTNRPVIRTMQPARVFPTEKAKCDAIVAETLELLSKGRPILIGLDSVERSEALSQLFTAANIEHQVLNAKKDDSEAEIVAQAGQAGRVTIATNMAGRGTDIRLGPGVVAAGGLHVILGQLNDSSRGDRQLQGRAGRQGDPGSSQIFVSFEDSILEALGKATWNRWSKWALGAPAEKLSRCFRLFRKAQKLRQRRHFRQRIDLMTHEGHREKTLKNLGADPLVD